MVRGGQNAKTSMARIMAWIMFGVIIFSWFWFPDRGVADLTIIYAAQLGYIYSGKWTYYKHGRRGGGDDSER
jgi:hypothetical protein